MFRHVGRRAKLSRHSAPCCTAGALQGNYEWFIHCWVAATIYSEDLSLFREAVLPTSPYASGEGDNQALSAGMDIMGLPLAVALKFVCVKATICL
jgi:hypothetical protein